MLMQFKHDDGLSKSVDEYVFLLNECFCVDDIYIVTACDCQQKSNI